MTKIAIYRENESITLKNVYERKGETKFGVCIGTICTGGKIHFCLVLIYGWRQEERKETEKLPSLCWNFWIMKKRDSPPLTPHQWGVLVLQRQGSVLSYAKVGSRGSSGERSQGIARQGEERRACWEPRQEVGPSFCCLVT